MNQYNSEEILLEKMKTFVLTKNQDYIIQIEKNLNSLADLYFSNIPLKPLRYSIVEEYNDCVIVERKDSGSIKVNDNKK